MLTCKRFLKLFLIFLVVSAEVNQNEEDTNEVIMRFHKDREEFLNHFDPAKIGYRMHVNSTVDDDEEPTSRIICFAFLKKIFHCGKALLGWGCGMCGWGCNVMGGILKIFKFIFRKRPGTGILRPPKGNPPASRPGLIGLLPSFGLGVGGFLWKRIQINTAKIKQKCFIFTGCYIPNSKRHESHIGPSGGIRGFVNRGRRG